jgi:hypothetical protein
MYDYIKRFFKFLFPIVGVSTLQVVADALAEVAYPRDRRTRYGTAYRRPAPYHSYNRVPYSGPTRDIFEKRPRTMEEQDKMERERIAQVRASRILNEERKRVSIRENNRSRPEGFADVLMVAFDLSGPNKEATHEWLMNEMPATGEHLGSEIDLDAWWIADDDGDSDCDSAVFVTKGCQATARKLLREHGLVE